MPFQICSLSFEKFGIKELGILKQVNLNNDIGMPFQIYSLFFGTLGIND